MNLILSSLPGAHIPFVRSRGFVCSKPTIDSQIKLTRTPGLVPYRMNGGQQGNIEGDRPTSAYPNHGLSKPPALCFGGGGWNGSYGVILNTKALYFPPMRGS